MQQQAAPSSPENNNCFMQVTKYCKMTLTDKNPYFWGLGGRYKMVSGQEAARNKLLRSCKQPPAEIRDFSRHPKC